MASEGVVITCNTKAEFAEQMAKANQTGKLFIIDFTASWCGPCRFMAPIFAEMAKRYPDVVFLKVDVDELKEIGEEYQIEAMPTFLFFKNGALVDKIVGARKEDLYRNIEKHYVCDTSPSASA